MKKMTIIIMAAALVLSSAIASIAADKLLDVKITNVTEKNDKNGNPYMRLSFDVDKQLGSVKYKETQSIMVFSDKIGLMQAIGIKPGSNFKGVCSENEYKGRMGYVFVAPDETMLKATAAPAPTVATATQPTTTPSAR